MTSLKLKTFAAGAVLALVFAGCGGDDDDETAGTGTAPAPQTTPAGGDDAKDPAAGDKKKPGKDGRYNNDPAVERDEGTDAVGSLQVKGKEFSLSRSEQALLSEGIWQVTFKNTGTIPHALDVEGPNGETESGEVAPGQKKTFKVYMVSGTYELYCPIGDHADKGMRTELPVRG